MTRLEYEEASEALTMIMHDPAATLGEQLAAWSEWCKLFDAQLQIQLQCVRDNAEYQL